MFDIVRSSMTRQQGNRQSCSKSCFKKSSPDQFKKARYSYLRGGGRRIVVWGQLGKSMRPYLKNKLKAKGLEV
jgi:hypothetical protein